MARRPDPQLAFAEVICERRKELDMSQEEVALAAGSTQGRISEIECGDNPSFGLAMRIARALGWSPVELVRRVEQRELGREPESGAAI